MKKIAVLISGSGSNLEAIIKACTLNKIEGTVESVICDIELILYLSKRLIINFGYKMVGASNFSAIICFSFFDLLDSLRIFLIRE